MVTFGTILKNGTFQFITAVDSFWATIGKIGLLLISTSGHTNCCWVFNDEKYSRFVNRDCQVVLWLGLMLLIVRCKFFLILCFAKSNSCCFLHLLWTYCATMISSLSIAIKIDDFFQAKSLHFAAIGRWRST